MSTTTTHAWGRPRTLPNTASNNHRRDTALAYYYSQEDIEGWARAALNNARRRARDKGEQFDLTLQDVIDAARDVTHCPITKEELIYRRGCGKAARNAASIDRKDNEHEYNRDTIAVISRWANTMKNNASIDEMINLGIYAMLRK